MSKIERHDLINNTDGDEPCLAECGELLTREEVVQAVSALNAFESAQTEDGTQGYCPPGVTFEMKADKEELPLKEEDLPPRLVGEADKLKRHTINNETTYPWCTVGKIYVGKDNDFNRPIWQGSGVLVGRNLLLTASHVAPWGKNQPWMKFMPAYKNGSEPFGNAYVLNWNGYRNETNVMGKDYIICKLNRNIGDQCGWMGSQWWSGQDNQYYNGRWTSVGYPVEPSSPGGALMMVEDVVKIVDVDDEGSDGKELESDVYSLGGWSGGPLWGNLAGGAKVIGVLSGEETDFLQPRHDVSAGGKAMGDLIVWGQNNYRP